MFFGISKEEIIKLAVSVIMSVITLILSKVVYNMKGYLKILKTDLPNAMIEAENNFPEGHGNYKQKVVIDYLLNVCHKKGITPNKRLFSFFIKLIVTLSKHINLIYKIPFSDNADEVIKKIENNENEIKKD